MPRDFGTTFVTQCAPVMAGLKAANLFRWVEPDAAALAGTLASWRRQLAPRGVEIETLHFCPRAHAYLIYVYRPARLQAILGRDAPRALLRAAGYPAAGGCRRCLDCLCARLRQGGEFPHEIGVFLDYPLADVVGFIQNRARIPPLPATGSLTRTPSRRGRSMRGCANAPKFICAVTAAERRSPG